MLFRSLINTAFRLVKSPLRKMIGNTGIMRSSFMLIRDSDDPRPQDCAPEQLRVDGHPMFNPKNRDWIINDSYPDDERKRDLYLFRFSDKLRIDLGRFRMSDEMPSAEALASVKTRLESQVQVPLDLHRYTFTQSGLHCDLHPRWFADGKNVAFDSIHEGTRQLYAINVATLLEARSQAASAIRS